MTDMEKKVMVRLCAKIRAESDLYETDKEIQNRKIVGTIRNVGRGDCYALILCWKTEIVSGIIK